jgi:hypothetical protein
MPHLVPNDPGSEVLFDELTAAIAWEMGARLAIGDRVDSVEQRENLAALIADTILDRFELRRRTDRRYSAADDAPQEPS